MGLSSATFPEVCETCGIDTGLFDLEQNTVEEFQVFVDRHLPIARADVRRGVGSSLYDTTDADRQLQIRSAEAYLCGARIIRAILNQHLLGLGPPLLMADAGDVRQLINDLKAEADRAIELAKLEAPNHTTPWGLAAMTTTQTDSTAAFTRGKEW